MDIEIVLYKFLYKLFMFEYGNTNYNFNKN